MGDLLLDINAKAAIAFSLTLIAGLLVYIAFFKGSIEKGRSKRSK